MTATGLTLYQLAEQFEVARWALESVEPDTPEYAEAEHMLDGINLDFAKKVDSIGCLTRDFEERARSRANESARLAALAASDSRRAERLREYILKQLHNTDRDGIRTNRFDVTIRKNPPKLEVTDASLIPKQFMRRTLTEEPDKVAIKAHMKKTGEVVPGAEVVRGEHLELK